MSKQSESKSGGKKKKHPFKKTFEVHLPSGQTVEVTISHTKEKVERPPKVEDGIRRITKDFVVPKLRKVRDRQGEVMTRTVIVPGVQGEDPLRGRRRRIEGAGLLQTARCLQDEDRPPGCAAPHLQGGQRSQPAPVSEELHCRRGDDCEG